MFKKRKIETDFEKQILIGFIMSDEFCQDILPIYKSEYFVMDYAKRVASWASKYFEQYDRAPKQHIQDLFEIESKTINPAEKELIRRLLADLSERFEGQDDNINKEYLFDQANLYFRKRAAELLSEKIKRFTDLGRIDEAEKAIVQYHKVDEKKLSVWFNPLDPGVINQTFVDRESLGLFRFPGALGKLIGDFEREGLYAFLGPMKRGKTTYLYEVAFEALLARKKVVYISLEMGKTRSKIRLYKKITGLADIGQGGKFKYPFFDCANNQDGTCNKKHRQSNTDLVRGDYMLDYKDFKEDSDYEPCSYCRERYNDRGDYIPAVWYVTADRGELSAYKTQDRVKKFSQMYGKNLRMAVYPAFSANLTDIENDLEILELSEEFIPEVIIIDTLDITAPEDDRIHGRDAIDLTWKRSKRLAQVRKCALFTGSQANKKTLDSMTVKASDISEDARKLAHSDGVVTLNQTPQEKDRGIIRMGIAVLREGDFSQLKQVMVLQNMTVGQGILDTEYNYFKPKEEEENASNNNNNKTF